MSKDDIQLLAMFFVEEFESNPTHVGEWVDNEGNFDDEEERDDFIARVKDYLRAAK